jgi:predicted GNAT superfamily acetyltransferase
MKHAIVASSRERHGGGMAAKFHTDLDDCANQEDHGRLAGEKEKWPGQV